MRGKTRRLTAVFAFAALGVVSAFAQFGSESGNLYGKFGPGGSKVEGLNGQPLDLEEGARVRIKGTDTVLIVGKNGVVLPVGVAITVEGKGGSTQEAVVPLPRTQHAFGVFPLTYFSIAGTLFDKSTNEIVSGTRTLSGSIYSYDVISNLDHGRRFEIGGFYFMPYDDGNGDLYQIAGRYFPNKEVGFQVAYLDTTRSQRASSGSFHVLFDLSSQGTGVTKGKRLTSRIGIGVLENFTKELSIESGSFVHRNTTNFSTFFDLGVELTSRLKFNASEWFVRDRNNDINRFGIGLSYKL